MFDSANHNFKMVFLITHLLMTYSAFAQTKIETWKDCQNPALANLTIPFHSDGTFRPECAPDTLYSWQNRYKLEEFKKITSKAGIINFKYLYTWRTPLMTSTYGDVQLRIKIKPGVHFVLIDEATQSRECAPDEKNTIHVGYYASGGIRTYSEYILCSPDVVESWSHDTPESWTEFKNEGTWIQTHQRDEFDYFELNELNISLMSPFSGKYGYKFKLKDLKKHFNESEVFCSDKTVPDTCKQSHFQTKNPGYFNINQP